jgi:hypothetical protein
MAKSKQRKRRRRRASGEYQRPQAAGPRREQRARPEPARRSAARDERPPAPWGSFPLQELTVLVALVILLIGFFSASPVAIAVGVVLGCLAGLELALREHFAGYRSHTFLLAGTAFVVTVGTLYYVGGLVLLVCLIAGAVVFVPALLALRSAFRRASGGLSFKAGRLRG